MTPAVKSWRRWTKEDKEELARMAHLPPEVIAPEVDRSVESVRQQLTRQGLYGHKQGSGANKEYVMCHACGLWRAARRADVRLLDPGSVVSQQRVSEGRAKGWRVTNERTLLEALHDSKMRPVIVWMLRRYVEVGKRAALILAEDDDQPVEPEATDEAKSGGGAG